MSRYFETGRRKKIPYCWTCKFFSISWDTSFPYSCDLMGFKSKVTPCIEVLRADGVRCLGYMQRDKKVILDLKRKRLLRKRRKINTLV